MFSVVASVGDVPDLAASAFISAMPMPQCSCSQRQGQTIRLNDTSDVLSIKLGRYPDFFYMTWTDGSKGRVVLKE